MKSLLYTILELEEWNKNSTCCFCYNKSVCQIRTRNKITHEIIANDESCENCKEKFENDELEKCERCGRLKNRHSYVCHCIIDNENVDEKELPILPHEEREATFYERQINSLREELITTEEALEIEREEVVKFQEKSEEWSKKQKQELLDKVKGLEEKIKQLEEENRKLKEEKNGQIAQIEVKETKRWSWLKIKK